MNYFKNNFHSTNNNNKVTYIAPHSMLIQSMLSALTKDKNEITITMTFNNRWRCREDRIKLVKKKRLQIVFERLFCHRVFECLR